MSEIQLLDCTLRDGGYLNDWEFGHDTIVSIFERVVDSAVDIIEVGFIDDRRTYDYNRTIFPDSKSIELIFGNLNRKKTMVVGMIDYGTCDISNIQPATESFVDGIRVIFKKDKRREAMEFCRELKNLGYDVFSQLVSVTSYSDDEMMDLISLANDVQPHAVSMVDTYGLMHQNNLLHYYRLLDENLDIKIHLGYHGHNNFQMGYANAIAFLSMSRTSERPLLIDGTLYGMGKSAGNGPIELIAMHLNEVYGKHYDVSQLLEAIANNIIPLKEQLRWGYDMQYYISALNDVHPNYVADLMSKRSLSVKQINTILSRMEPEKKLLYNHTYLEEKYRDFLSTDVDDSNDIKALNKEMNGCEVLLLGPGPTIDDEEAVIRSYIKENNPIIVSINYLPHSFKVNFIFLSNTKRYVQLATDLSKTKTRIIATSNVTSAGNSFDYTLDVTALFEEESLFIDNSLLMALKAFRRIGVKSVSLAGFDGYSQNECNYFDPSKEYAYAREKADYLNLYVSDFLKNYQSDVNVKFVTSTRYRV